MHAWKLDHFVVWWFFCLFLVLAFLCFVVVVLVCLVGFVAVVVVWFGFLIMENGNLFKRLLPLAGGESKAQT